MFEAAVRARRIGLARPMVLFVAAVAVAGVAIGLWVAVRWDRETRDGGPIASKKHHVVLIVVDTLRRDALGCYGNGRRPSPAIDAVAGQGVRFDQAISASSWTLPSVASLLTGTWPTLHGALGKRTGRQGERRTRLTPIRDEVITAAEVLSKSGFRTIALTNHVFVSELVHLDRGFDVFDNRPAYNKSIRRADEMMSTALDYIRAGVDGPNFVFLHLFDPHLNYDPPGEYASKYTGGRTAPAAPLSMKQCVDMQTKTGKGVAGPPEEDIAHITAVYHGEVSFVDDQIGRLIGELVKMGIYDETAILITADHGEEFWDHDRFEHGHSMYDELIRVPLIVKLPRHITPAKRVVSTQVRVLDVMPTVFEMVGVEKPESFVGNSLLPLIMGEAEPDRIAFSEGTLHGTDKISWRTDRYKYMVEFVSGDKEEARLYDWRNDPDEKENLIEKLPDIAAKLEADLSGFHMQLEARARSMSKPTIAPESPDVTRSLKSLGYIR